SSARNLGVVFESDLSFDQHISNICRSSFYHIRQLRQIRPSLDLNSSILSLTIMPYYLPFLFLRTLDFLESPNLSAILNQLMSLLFPMIFSLPVFTLFPLSPYPPTSNFFHLLSHVSWTSMLL